MPAKPSDPPPAVAAALPKLGPEFYQRSALELAQAVIGKILVHHVRKKRYRARIVEAEAYVGSHDLASHASKGRTSRTEVMFGPPGRTYIYLIYGMYEMLNIVAGEVDDPQAVLLRAAEALDGWQADLSGPGKLTRALQIQRSENGLAMTGDKLYLLDDPNYLPRIQKTKRIGVDYAQEWKDQLFRFLDANSRAVSKGR